MAKAWTTKDGAKLRSARKRLGLSQAQLGRATGVSGSRISEIEKVTRLSGRRFSPGARLGGRIADHLAELAGGAAEAKPAKRSHHKKR